MDACGRVLLVHDDAHRRVPIKAAISGLGFEVVEASTPVEAIWELENGPMDFHAAVIARELGGTSGPDVAHFISLRYPGVTKVLFGGGDPAELDGAQLDAALDSMGADLLRGLGE
jgi:CheY-like chemotaxis protein